MKSYQVISIDKKLKEKLPLVSLVCFESAVEVNIGNTDLWDEIGLAVEKVKASTTLEEVAHISPVASTRAAYKILGKDPSRYRPSAEALIRRIVAGNGLYKINNVVDILNWISFSTGYSIGGYDLDKIEGDVLLTCGTAEDHYEAIGRGVMNITNLPVLKDSEGCFGTPTSDSVRTSVTNNTKNFLMVFFGFDKSVEKEAAPGSLVISHLKKYALAREVNKFVVF